MTNQRFKFYDIGFHGDNYLLHLVDVLASKSYFFIETGANVGSTVAYVAKKYPSMKCISCEPDSEAYTEAVRNAPFDNVSLFNESSQNFLLRLRDQYPDVFHKNALYWLDAHGYGFTWPLRDEVSFITNNCKSAFILIDDFKVPGLDCFGYDSYEDQECSFEYIADSLNPSVPYDLYYPSYTDKTSKHHPLRGWCLLAFGQGEELRLPEALLVRVTHKKIIK